MNHDRDRLIQIMERYKNAPTRKLGSQLEVVNVDKEDLEWLITEVDALFFDSQMVRASRSKMAREENFRLRQMEEQNRLLTEMLAKKRLSEPLTLSIPEGYVVKTDEKGNIIQIEKGNKATEWKESELDGDKGQEKL